MIKTNWHTHTSRCGHAVGTDEEYVLAAIHAGLKTLGFSDHAAYIEPRPTERMNIEQFDEYCESILSLKEKYKDQIDIYLGMEVEYYPDQWETLSKYRKQLDYCILGQHELSFNGKSSYHLSTPQDIKDYVDALELACQRHLCDYIAHPDLLLFSYPRIDEHIIEAAKRIAKISIEYDMPLELNCGLGVRRGLVMYEDGPRYPYPTKACFEIFAEYQCPIVFGLDIHDPKLFFTDEYVDKAYEVVKDLNCNIIDDYDLVAHAKKRKELFI